MADLMQPPPSTSPDNLDIWFQRIFNEIDVLSANINKKEGFFFKTHVYSEDQLLSSESFGKINAMVQNIENLFENWIANSAISDERRKEYWLNRLKVERLLGETRARIIERKPTFWEEIVRTLTKLINFVMKHLPELPGYIMAKLGYSFNDRQVRIARFRDIDPDEV